MAQMLNNDNFNSSVETGVCVVDFFATWCGPCKMLSLVLDQIKDVKIVKVDVDESPNLCKQYAIMSVPTVINISESAIRAVPKEMRSASLALGASKIQTILHKPISETLNFL